MNKLMSIGIPAYNNGAYIGETIESILAQTYENLELVIVDDHSSDNTYEVLEEYARKDSRVRIFRNEKNLGMSGNWNRCLELCTGDYLKLVCADDLLDPQMIEKEIKVLEKYPDVVLVGSDTRLIDLQGHYKGWYKRYKHSGAIDGSIVARKGFFRWDYFGAPQANTFRRSAFEQVGGFSSEFHYIVDYDFFVNVAKLGRIYIIHEPLNYFRVRGDSNTGQVMGEDKEKTRIYIEEHVRLFQKNKQDLGLSNRDIKYAIFMRKLRCFMASVYLKVFVR